MKQNIIIYVYVYREHVHNTFFVKVSYYTTP